MTYTISAKQRNGTSVIPLRRYKVTIDDAMMSACNFSLVAILCDVVVLCGTKHIATYRGGKITHHKGKEAKP